MLLQKLINSLTYLLIYFKIYCIKNKTGLQPVSRPVERIHYLGGGGGVGFKVPLMTFWQEKIGHFAYICVQKARFVEKNLSFRGKTNRQPNHLNTGQTTPSCFLMY